MGEWGSQVLVYALAGASDRWIALCASHPSTTKSFQSKYLHEWCAIDAQGDFTSISRVWAGEAGNFA